MFNLLNYYYYYYYYYYNHNFNKILKSDRLTTTLISVLTE